MAYTGYGFNIEVIDLWATYASWLHKELGAEDIPIVDRSHFDGRVEFKYKSATAFYCTYGFYLNMGDPRINPYSFVSEILYAAADWNLAYKTTPWTWFMSYGLAGGRTIDTLKEIWLGQINLGSPIWVDDWINAGHWGRIDIACEYGLYWTGNTWINVRTGDEMPRESLWGVSGDWLTEVDWLNQFIYWKIGQDITFEEWHQGGAIDPAAHRRREIIAGRSGIVWTPGVPSYWVDTKTLDRIIGAGNWDAELEFLNTHQVRDDMRIASDWDREVYIILKQEFDISSLEATYQ